MEHKRDYSDRQLVIGAIAIGVVIIFLVRLLMLQLMSDDYKRNADSNALLKKNEYPSRGVIYDRNGELMVYNQPSYSLMVVMNEVTALDTLDLCQTLNISREQFDKRMADIKNTYKNPGYSRFTQQLFMSQLSEEEFAVFNEKLFRYPGFYIEKRATRQYVYPIAAHVLGDVAEVSQDDIDNDDYYQPGDFIGKQGVERAYERQLRGEKGVQIFLRDAHGSIKGKYKEGMFDRRPVAGRNLTLSIDRKLQALGERLLEGKIGAIVAIEPSTGEVLCMVSSPSYDPNMMIGRARAQNHLALQRDTWKPLLNRAIMGQYPPGSTFKTGQALTFLSEGVVTTQTAYPCYHGFLHKGLRVGCHGHASPTALHFAISTSCNAYFCWGLNAMLSNRQKYPTVQVAMNRWRDYMVSMGFGYKLGIDLPGEKRGLIPNADFYDNAYKGSWNALTIISISIGQGEVNLTPLQIANLGATIANRGYFITPHVVKQIEGEALDTLYTQRRYTMATREAYNEVVTGMRASVLGGTCRAANSAAYEVCGKTGTAQNRGRDHSVFMGFAPKDDPQIAIAVYVENGGFGAEYGVPIGALMMEQYLTGGLSESSEAKATAYQNRRIAYGSSVR